MIKKAIGIITIVFLQFNLVLAQSSFEIGSVYSLTAEKLNSVENTSRQLYHSFGINVKKTFKSNVFVQTGLYFKNFGSNVGEEDIIIDDLPSEIGGQSIDIPISVGYYFLNNDKIRLGMSLGVNNGFLQNQYQDFYNARIETVPYYNDFLLYLNSSVEIGIQLTNHIILDIKPIFQRQINSNYGRNYKQNGIGCQFGISYDFQG